MREIIDFNNDWQYHYGEVDNENFDATHGNRFENPRYLKSANNGVSKVHYPSSDWENVILPHDFVVHEGKFSKDEVACEGSLKRGIVWYRKQFFVPKEYEGKSLWIEFDGVFRESNVFVNGHDLLRNQGGYTSFLVDVTNHIYYGEENAIAVLVDATNYEGWWYEGGGIYRDVRFIVANTSHILKDGIFAKTDVDLDTKEASIEVLVETTKNDGEFLFELYDQNEICIKTKENKFKVSDVKLWSVDSPILYKLKTSLIVDDKIVDSVDTVIGFKKVTYEKGRGFCLNGRNIKLQGVCCHEDHAGVGTAVTKEIAKFRIKKLKEMGINAYRTSHNPPTPSLLEACDELGMLVMDEIRVCNYTKEGIWQLETLIKRDRNHPSVFMWSIGNEEMQLQTQLLGTKIMQKLYNHVKELDSTRAVTYAMNGMWLDYYEMQRSIGYDIDVPGFNYYMLRDFDIYKEFHEKFPDRFLIATETGGDIVTRGKYHMEKEDEDLVIHEEEKSKLLYAPHGREGYQSAYGGQYPVWGTTPKESYDMLMDNDYAIGMFYWTGFDYRGETFPYRWPSVVSRYGLLDLCGFMKDTAYFFKSVFTKEPMLHVMPSWDMPKMIEKEVEVRVYTNLDYVRIFVNGECIKETKATIGNEVSVLTEYIPGELVVKGYKVNDKEPTCIVKKTTPNKAKRLKIKNMHNKELNADGKDVSIYMVYLEDDKGNQVTSNDIEVRFETSDDIEIIGTGNGNPLSHEHDKKPVRKLYHGLCQLIVRAKQNVSRESYIKASSKSVESAILKVKLNKVKIDLDPLKSKGIVLNKKEEYIDAADGGI